MRGSLGTVALLVGMFLQACDTGDIYDWSEEVTGHVRDRETGAPIGEATVRLWKMAYAPGETLETVVSSDVNGRYSVSNFGFGNFDKCFLSVSKPEYQNRTYLIPEDATESDDHVRNLEVWLTGSP